MATMKGYVLHGKDKAGWQDVPVPKVGPHDALVRPSAVAACTTDVHLIASGALPTAIGRVIGHEAVGIIEQVGNLVKDFKPGDRVIIPTGTADWLNPRAQRGEARYHQANNFYVSDKPGLGGSFSELVRVFNADLTMARIPASVTDIQAVMVGDMVGTGFAGVERMQIQMGETVLIIGIGPVGLMGVAGAALKGAGRIIAVGSRPKTVELARHYGATDIIDYHDGDIVEQVFKLTDGEPVDSVLIASGGHASEMFTAALSVVKYGGHVANVSAFMEDETVTIPMKVLSYGFIEKFFTGAIVLDGRDFLERALLLIENGKLDPAPLVTHVLHGWDKLEEGLALMRGRDPSVIKPVIVI